MFCVFSAPFPDQVLSSIGPKVVPGGAQRSGPVGDKKQSRDRAPQFPSGFAAQATTRPLSAPPRFWHFLAVFVNLCHDDGAQQEICCSPDQSPQTTGRISQHFPTVSLG